MVAAYEQKPSAVSVVPGLSPTGKREKRKKNILHEGSCPQIQSALSIVPACHPGKKEKKANNHISSGTFMSAILPRSVRSTQLVTLGRKREEKEKNHISSGEVTSQISPGTVRITRLAPKRKERKKGGKHISQGAWHCPYYPPCSEKKRGKSHSSSQTNLTFLQFPPAVPP